MKSVLKKELIGMHMEVTESVNKCLVGIKGKIVDETKNMIILDNNKMLQKQSIKINVVADNEMVNINGRILIFRPEDRLKMVVNGNA